MVLSLTNILDASAPFTAEDFLNKLFPNFWSFIINLLALVALFVALYFIAYKPLRRVIKARKDYIEHNLRDSEKAKEISERKASEGDQVVSDAKKQASTIIAKAKSDATISANEILVSAQKAAAEKQKAADEAIRQEEEKSRQVIHDEIVSVALAASKQVLGREVNEKDNARLVSEFVKNVTKQKEKEEKR